MAAPSSNYCRPHFLQLANCQQATQSPTSFALAAFLAFVALVSGAYWAADDLKNWLGPLLARATVYTSAFGNCEAPVEGERLMIIVTKRAGRIAVEGCMFVGSTGTYAHRPR